MINFLKEMGIQQWRRRSPDGYVEPVTSSGDEGVNERLVEMEQAELADSFTAQTFESTQVTPKELTQDVGDFDLDQSEQSNGRGFPAEPKSGSLKQVLEQQVETNTKPEITVSPNNVETKSEARSNKTDSIDENTSEGSKPKKAKPLILTGLIDEDVNESEVPVHIPDVEPVNENFTSGVDQSVSVEDSLPSLESDNLEIHNGSWESLEALIQTNEHCPSCGWGNAFLGSGDRQADWLFVIDAPNKIETQEKTFFTGRSGQLFEAMLLALGLDRSNVYATSVFKCAPTEDLTLTPQCNAILAQQINLVMPKVIVTFGEFAAQAVIKSNLSLNSLREQDNELFTNQAQNSRIPVMPIPVIPTFTPAQMLDDNSLKAMVWADLKKALRLFEQ